MPHEGISSLVATAVDRMNLRRDSRVLQFASTGFDVFVFELSMALCHGGSLVLVTDEARVAGPALTDFLADRRITHMILPPSLVSALPPGCELPEGSTVLVGTETVPPDLFDRFGATADLICAYGLTEATVNSTLWRAREHGGSPAYRVPIGRARPQHPRLRARRAAAARTGGCGGRAVRRRTRARPRLPRQGGTHLGAVRRGPLRGARQPDVPHRRPRPCGAATATSTSSAGPTPR